MRNPSFVLTLFLAALLSACSGDKDRPSDSAPHNSPPVFTSGALAQAAENIKESFFTVQATDTDSELVSYGLQGVDAEWFAVDSLTGAVRFVQPPDFETPRDADGDNRYELVAAAWDSDGGQSTQALVVEVSNVIFAYEFLSPLPNTILERERYSRLPIGVWVEYDYSERLQIICNGEILNKASDSGATWTGSIALPNGDVDVKALFYRGDEVIETLVVPVRHQHVISAPDNLAYDSVNDHVLIPHEARLETLLIDADYGASQKRYPWIGRQAELSDIVFDVATGSAIYADGSVHRLQSFPGSATAVVSDLNGTFVAGETGGLAYDEERNSVFVASRSGGSRYVQLDLGIGTAQEREYNSTLEHTAAAALAFDGVNDRLFLAPANAEGVEAIAPGSSTPLATLPISWPDFYSRVGETEYDAARNALFLAGSASDSLIKLDVATGTFAVASGRNFLAAVNANGGGDNAEVGGGEPLLAPHAMAFDSQRDRVLVTSARRLLAINPDTGDRTAIFDSVAGTGDLATGFAGIWISRDGAQAIAIDKRVGQYFAVDLRTGGKTLRPYQAGIARDAWADYVVQRAKISSDGEMAAIYYRKLDSGDDRSQDVLDLVNLRSGVTQVVLNNSAERTYIDFNFSRPNDQVVLLVEGTGGTTLQVYSLPNRTFLSTQSLPDSAGITATLAVHLVSDRFYLLERGRNGTGSPVYFQLSELNDELERTPLFSFPDTGTDTNDGVGINTMFDGSLLAVLLPEQSPKFWNITAGTEEITEISAFHGRDQAKDFYTVDDFREFYYFRANAGLHVCWRSNCAILAN